jgi:hypothetical protein
MPTAHNTDQAAPTLCSRTDLKTVQAHIQHLGQLATAVLNEHVNDRGSCAACHGATFPCDLAVLAEHNMALL